MTDEKGARASAPALLWLMVAREWARLRHGDPRRYEALRADLPPTLLDALDRLAEVAVEEPVPPPAEPAPAVCKCAACPSVVHGKPPVDSDYCDECFEAMCMVSPNCRRAEGG